MLHKFQVWVRGSDLYDISAENERMARKTIKEFFGFKRLPKNTHVCKIPENYYDSMVKNNQSIGIDASNM